MKTKGEALECRQEENSKVSEQLDQKTAGNCWRETAGVQSRNSKSAERKVELGWEGVDSISNSDAEQRAMKLQVAVCSPY